MKILLVEDDEKINDSIVEYFRDEHYHYIVELAIDGQAAWDLLEVFSYDLIILDINLPKLDGITLCQRLRSKKCLTPILMLTGRDGISDRVLGLDVGADDYLIKPFSLSELSARIRALLRRGNGSLPPILEWGDLSLNPSSQEVFYQEKPVDLSPKQYSLLEFFLRHQRQVFSRGEILENIWDYDRIPEEATIKTHIRSLRQKLMAVGLEEDFIETVHGRGYRLKEPPNKVKKQ